MVALPAGRRLGPAQLALAASAGMDAVTVVRSANVAIWLAGPKHQACEVLADALSLLVARDGGVARCRVGAWPEGGADAVLLVGRSGWGADDDAALRLEAAGGRLEHHGIAMIPGGSAGLGWAGAVPVVLLPGDPYAALATYEVLAGRLLRRLAGRPAAFAGGTRRCVLARKVASPVGWAEFVPIVCAGGTATPVAPSPSDGLACLARADGFLLVPAGLEGYAEGTEVEIVMTNAGGMA
jgi:molybdopterin molybdotransferase